MGYIQQYQRTKYAVNLVSKLQVKTVVKDEIVEQVITEVTQKLYKKIRWVCFMEQLISFGYF